MFDEIKKELSSIRILIFLLIAAVGIYLFGILWQVIGVFSDVIIVLIFSWLLSFMLEPVVKKISQAIRLSKTLAAILVYVFFFFLIALAIFLLIPTVTDQIKTLSEIVPNYLKNAPDFINRWGDMFFSSLNNAIGFLPSVAQFLFLIFIVFIISFYLIVDKEKINDELMSLTPKNWREKIEFFQKVIDNAFSSFLRVQLTFGIISGVLTWLILSILGIQFATTAAVLAGIFAVIPLIGPILAIIPPVFVAFVTEPQRAILIFIILLVAQQFIFNVLGPKLLSGAFKIHPIVVLISFLVGAKIAGPIGAVFAIPVLGILIVVFHELSRYRFESK